MQRDICMVPTAAHNIGKLITSVNASLLPHALKASVTAPRVDSARRRRIKERSRSGARGGRDGIAGRDDQADAQERAPGARELRASSRAGAVASQKTAAAAWRFLGPRGSGLGVAVEA
jgi:hypothetical protein